MRDTRRTWMRVFAGFTLVSVVAFFAATFHWGVAYVDTWGQPRALLMDGSLRVAVGDRVLRPSPPLPLTAPITMGLASGLAFQVAEKLLDASRDTIRVPLWPLLVVFAVLLAFVWNRRPLDYRPLTCAECGYDLRGSPGDRCPECGTSFTRASSAHGALAARNHPGSDGGK